MIVNDFVKTIGYSRNRLSHFEFSLWDSESDAWICIKNATADDYIFLCDREVSEWMIESNSPTEEIMSFYLKMEPGDREIFSDYIKY